MTAEKARGVTAGERFRSWPEIQANAARGAGGLAASRHWAWSRTTAWR